MGAKGATVPRLSPPGEQRVSITMRCYFLRGGHILAVEELTGLSDKEAIEKAHVLVSERENPVGAFEVWDQRRVIIGVRLSGSSNLRSEPR